MASADPNELVDRLSELARAERGRLCAVARAEGLSAEDAVDCVQEGLCTLLDLAQGGQLQVPASQWGDYLGGIVRNAARNRRRRHFNARPHASLELDSVLPLDTPDAEAILAQAEQYLRLRACVEELCDIQKAVVTLRMLEELPGEDVASSLGISAGHVAVLLHRAKGTLRACMTVPRAD